MLQQQQQTERLYTACELAEVLNVSTAWVRKHTRFGLPVVKCGKAARYNLTQVLAWLQAKQSHKTVKRAIITNKE